MNLQVIAKSKESATIKNRGVCSFTHIPDCFLEELVLLPWLRELTPSNQKYLLDKPGSSGLSEGWPPCREERTLPVAKAGHCSFGYQQALVVIHHITPSKMHRQPREQLSCIQQSCVRELLAGQDSQYETALGFKLLQI